MMLDAAILVQSFRGDRDTHSPSTGIASRARLLRTQLTVGSGGRMDDQFQSRDLSRGGLRLARIRRLQLPRVSRDRLAQLLLHRTRRSATRPASLTGPSESSIVRLGADADLERDVQVA